MVQQQLSDTNKTPHDPSEIREGGYVVGVDIGGTNLRVALADCSGKIVAKWTTPTVGIQDAPRIVDLIHCGVNHLLKQESVPRAELKAIAAGAPGITNTDTGVVVATSYLMGWRNVPLRDQMEAAIGVPAAVDNDVNLAALGELWAGAAKGTSNFVFLAIGTGVGAGIVLNDRLFHGDGWVAGEIGYMLVPGASERPVERGKPGALEGLVGGEGIKAQWQSLCNEAGSGISKDLSATEIFDLALQGNADAQSILVKASQSLTYCIYNISLILNCSLFLLGGAVGLHPALRDMTARLLAERGPRVQPKLATSILGAEAQLVGAVFLALETANVRRVLSA